METGQTKSACEFKYKAIVVYGLAVSRYLKLFQIKAGCRENGLGQVDWMGADTISTAKVYAESADEKSLACGMAG